MELIIGIFLIVLFFVAWIVWSILLCAAFLLAILLPWGIWEGFMYLTFNNLINLVAKIPTFIGVIIGFLFALPFAIPGIVISIWCYIQVIFMALLIFNGDPTSDFATNYLSSVSAWEFDTPGSLFIARFFHDHCQWLWGGAGMFRGYFFWQNGVWMDIGEELPVPMIIVKLFLLAIPYMLMFLLPLFPVLWSITRPFVGALSLLPAVSGNGDGRGVD